MDDRRLVILGAGPTGTFYEADDHVGGAGVELRRCGRLVDTMLGEDYSVKLRAAWVWMLGRFLPYPFRNNIGHLPKKVRGDRKPDPRP